MNCFSLMSSLGSWPWARSNCKNNHTLKQHEVLIEKLMLLHSKFFLNMKKSSIFQLISWFQIYLSSTNLLSPMVKICRFSKLKYPYSSTCWVLNCRLSDAVKHMIFIKIIHKLLYTWHYDADYNFTCNYAPTHSAIE